MPDAAYVFGSFRLVPSQRLLLDEGIPVRLGSRAFDILNVLVESAGETVSNDEIMAHAWPATTVDESSLRVHIGALRKALGEGRGGNRYIANVPGRGYTFVASTTRGQSSPQVISQAPPASGSFPTSLANVIGRTDTIAALGAQLARHRLVTIVGPGGIGKTTVAVAVAHSAVASHPDGVWFAALAPLADPGLVASTIAAAAGLASTGGDALTALIAWLRDKQALIVLDNCEHVVDAAAMIAEAILNMAPRITIMATSREPLRAQGEWLHRLAPLALPPGQPGITASEALEHSAVQLFHERILATGGEFVLSDADAPAVCEICRKLDGLPLALELAAVQADFFGIQGLAQGLNDRFAFLVTGRRTAMPRQQTLRATIDWSYDLLPESEQIVLRRLAAFRGDFTIEAACAVVGNGQLSEAEIVDKIANLAAKSLVTTDIGGEITYHRLLDTTRAYALEKLIESGERDRINKRHAAYYRDLFGPAEAESESQPQAEWLATYARHLDDVRAAADWAFSPVGDVEIGVALTVAAVPLWFQLSLLSECRERVGRALASLGAPSPATARARMQLSAALGWSLMYGIGRAREAGPAWATTLELAEQLEDADYRQRALWGLCIDQFNNGEFRAALEYAQRFAALVEGSTDAIELIMGDRILATALHYLGDQKAARPHIDRVIARLDALRRQPQIVRLRFDMRVSAHYFQARILWLQGFADQALRVVEHNVEEGLAIGHALSFCSVLGQGACPITLLSGHLDAAERYGAMLLVHTERHPVRLWHLWARSFNGLIVAKRGDIAAGLTMLRAGIDEVGEAKFLPRFLLLLGELAACLGMGGQAKQGVDIVDEALARCEMRDERWYLPELLRIKGELIVSQDAALHAAEAEALFRRALDLAHQQGALSWELRTATSLARLWRESGRRDQADALLRPIYARFTEGFATADLGASNAFLEELA